MNKGTIHVGEFLDTLDQMGKSSLLNEGDGELQHLANVFGLDWRLPVKPEPQETAIDEPVHKTGTQEGGKSEFSDHRNRDETPDKSLQDPQRFWQLVQRTYRSDAELESLLKRPTWIETVAPESSDQWQLQGNPLPGAPLMKWSRLWPFLKRALGQKRPSRHPDISRLTRLLAKGEAIRRIPLKDRSSWSTELLILVDRREALSPFRQDYDYLIKQLARIRGDFGVQIINVKVEDGELIDASNSDSLLISAAGATVLSLGDLGQFGRSDLSSAWLRWGKKARARGNRLWALCPCPRSRWSGPIAEVWNCVLWDRDSRPPLHGKGQRQRLPDPQQSESRSSRREQRLGQLFAHVSPGIRVETGFLRDVRLLVDADAGLDVGTEYDAFQSSDAGGTGEGLTLHTDKLRHWRQEFAMLPDETILQVLRLLKQHHHYSKNIFNLEELEGLLEFLPDSKRHLLEQSGWLTEDSEQQIQDHWRQRGALLLDGKYQSHQQQMAAYSMRGIERLDGTIEKSDAKQIVWALNHRDHTGELPAKIDRQNVAFILDDESGPVQTHQIQWQTYLNPGGGNSNASSLGSVTSSLSHYYAKVIGDDQSAMEFRGLWGDPLGCSESTLYQARAIHLDARVESITLENRLRPEWASRMWYDQFGLAAEFQIGGVPFVMRWIPPGRFYMGSPEGEDGRFDDESPQHLVQITEGFWMGETPVTQQQWAAVVGEAGSKDLKPSPSHFKGPAELPVESVNWEECVEYCQQVNLLLGEAESNFRLPTEAEWEYACRGETQTSIYTGGMKILGENNAPALDEIAWYGGNSGVDLEVENPAESKWDEMQYEFSKAGTHRVKGKQPNGWGLYDILGNVWEWCADSWDENAYQEREEGLTDPYVHAGDDGAQRVFRGGSWDFEARYCRSAYRYRIRPDNRRSDLGLRLSASRERAPVPESAEPKGAERKEQA